MVPLLLLELFSFWFIVCSRIDYDGNEKAQLEYAKTHPRWVLPRRYYTFTKKVGNGVTAQFFMLDTTPLYYHGHELKRYGLTKVSICADASATIILGFI